MATGEVCGRTAERTRRPPAPLSTHTARRRTPASLAIGVDPTFPSSCQLNVSRCDTYPRRVPASDSVMLSPLPARPGGGGRRRVRVAEPQGEQPVHPARPLPWVLSVSQGLGGAHSMPWTDVPSRVCGRLCPVRCEASGGPAAGVNLIYSSVKGDRCSAMLDGMLFENRGEKEAMGWRAGALVVWSCSSFGAVLN